MSTEEEVLLEQLGSEVRPLTLHDDLHRRISGALEDPLASTLDRAVLLRQLLRRWSLRDGRSVPVQLAERYEASMLTVASRVGLREVDGWWSARPWMPSWLERDGGTPDMAAVAGTSAGRRFHSEPILADPFFTDVTGFPTYRTPGQRAACRAVMTVPEGSTVVSMLPTGSGKTEVALCLAERNFGCVTVIVVPTVALAYDFERRFRDHYARKNPRVKRDELVFAWTADTSETNRDVIRHRVLQGMQRVLVTSPESLTRALRQTMMDAASVGRLGGFVIDEAHLVTQWGRFFRPEFRTLSDLRRDLLEAAGRGGHIRPVTLLLSATLGSAEIEDLAHLFGQPGPFTPIVANALRSETEIWIAQAADDEERLTRVMDALDHVARPAVLYVTSPEDASRWFDTLRESGYRRVALVTGETKGSERARVLAGLRALPSEGPVCDLVVATSAFGLGIDYPHIRTVLHACLPETVDRWYQEMGRGGRDGDVSSAFLVTAPDDGKEASRMGVKVLTPDIARARWEDIWSHRRERGGKAFLDLEGARGSIGRGDFNRRWNAHLIQGLVELGELDRVQFDSEDVRELLNSDDAQVSDWTAVRRVSAQMGDSSFWPRTWGEWQRQEMGRSSESFKAIEEVSQQAVGACAGIAGAYSPSVALIQKWGPLVQFMEPTPGCGRCPDCRLKGVPIKEDPAPSPPQEWTPMGEDYLRLRSFVKQARGENGVAFITLGDTEQDHLPLLVSGLRRIGVRHLGGISPQAETSPEESVLFVDDQPLSPLRLTPFPSLSWYPPGSRISRLWRHRRTRERLTPAGQPLADVLVVPEGAMVGDLRVGRAIPSLSARTAVQLLGRG